MFQHKLIFLFIGILLFMSVVSAFDFDNVLVVESQTNDYPVLHIDNLFGIGSRLATLRLQENTDQCLINCYAIINVTLFDDLTLMDEFNFVDNGLNSKIQGYNVYYLKRDAEDVEFNDYGEVCSIINGTEICNEEVIGTHFEEVVTYDWKKYKGEELPPGNYLIKVESKRDEVVYNQPIDWAFSMAGIPSEEIRQQWAWWDSDWLKRRVINITGASEGLTYYPILINVTYDSDMEVDFKDLRFVNGTCDGTQITELNYEIDNKINSSYAEIWVNLPSLSSQGQICMYYDNSAASNGENPDGVWTNYVMVYHFNDHGLSLKDSSSTHTNGTANGDPSYNPYGRIGGSYYFDGNDYFETTGATTPHPTGTVTIEVFGNTTTASAGSNFWISQFESTSGTAVGGIIQWTGTADIRFSHDSADDAENTWDSGIDYTVNDYDFITAVWADGSQVPFVNKQGGVEQTDTGANWNYAANARFFVGDWKDNAALAWLGDIDELRVSNVSRSSAWINRTYDITDFTLISIGDEGIFSQSLTVNLDYPNNLTFFSNSIPTNATTIPSDLNFVNATGYVWSSDGSVYTTGFQTLTGNTSKNINQTHTVLVDDYYYWNFEVCGITFAGIHNCSMSAVNRSFILDTTDPIISFPTESYGYHLINTNITFNWTITELYPSDCFYIYDSVRYPVACNNLNSSVNVTDYNKRSLEFFANDTSNHLTNTNLSWNYDVFENSKSYNFTSLETTTENFAINVSYNNTKYTLFTADLIFNNSRYPTTSSGSGFNRIFTRAITIPDVSSYTNLSFFYEFNLLNATETRYYNSTFANQSVSSLGSSYCGAIYNVSFLNISVYDEDNKTLITPQFDVTFNYGVSEKLNSLSYANSNESFGSSFSFCFNPADKTYNTDGIVEFTRTGYVTETFNFLTFSINNVTTNRSIYLLPSSRSTSFIIHVRDSDYSDIPEAIVLIQRYYPNDNTWVTVESVETNIEGKSVGHFVTEDIYYRFAVYVDEVLEYTSIATKVACESSPCTITLNLPAGISSGTDYFNDIGNLTSTLTYSNTTQTFTYTYSDTNDDAEGGRLVVNMLGLKTESITICNSNNVNSNGVITCDISSYNNGTFIATGYITRGGVQQIAKRITIIKDFGIISHVGVDGVLWAILLIISITMLGLFKPAIAIVFSISAVIFVSLVGFVALPISAIISFIIIAIFLLWEFRT